MDLVWHWMKGSWSCFLFKQKTAYEVRISDWSSDVCSSDLGGPPPSCQRGRFVTSLRRASRTEPSCCSGTEDDQENDMWRLADRAEIGRASVRERVWQSV